MNILNSSKNIYNAYLEHNHTYGVMANMSSLAANKNTQNIKGKNTGHKGSGLMYYKKWWERQEVDIFIKGQQLTGIPIFTNENTIRVINNDYSYFIPIENIDYIRTNDGLSNSEAHTDII